MFFRYVESQALIREIRDRLKVKFGWVSQVNNRYLNK